MCATRRRLSTEALSKEDPRTAYCVRSRSSALHRRDGITALARCFGGSGTRSVLSLGLELAEVCLVQLSSTSSLSTERVQRAAAVARERLISMCRCDGWDCRGETWNGCALRSDYRGGE